MAESFAKERSEPPEIYVNPPEHLAPRHTEAQGFASLDGA
jgi:hypothetical protein